MIDVESRTPPVELIGVRAVMKVLVIGERGHITETAMIKGLRREGIDVYAAFASKSDCIDELKGEKIPVYPLNFKNNVDFKNAKKLRRWIKSEGFDIVHGLANKPIANAIWASYGLKNKLIAYRGTVGHVSKWDPTCYLKWLNPRVDKFVCVSRAVERDLASHGVPVKKLCTIYKGHDLSWYATVTRVEARKQVCVSYGIPKDAVIVGLAANMRRQKGADLLLRSLHTLPKNVHALLIGEVRDPLVKELARHPDISSRVHFTGYQTDAPALIASLDINVAPSRGREGLTKTVIEAMAQGIPCVVSDAGGLPELVRDRLDGMVVQEGSLEELAHAIAELAGNKSKRSTLGDAALERIRAHFTTQETILNTVSLYKQML